jgi:flagellar basal body-associated protein FliL
MSEELETNDGSWSGLKKTIIAAITTAVTAGGAWFTSTLFSSESDEAPKTEVAAPAPAPVINLSVDNSSQNNSSNNGGGTKVVERVVEKPVPTPAKSEKKSETEDAPW